MKKLPQCKYCVGSRCSILIGTNRDVPQYPIDRATSTTDNHQCIYSPEDVIMCPNYETKGVRVEQLINYLTENRKGGIWIDEVTYVSNSTIKKWLEESGGMTLCR